MPKVTESKLQICDETKQLDFTAQALNYIVWFWASEWPSQYLHFLISKMNGRTTTSLDLGIVIEIIHDT